MHRFLSTAVWVIALLFTGDAQAQTPNLSDSPEIVAQQRGPHRRPSGKRPRQGKAQQGDRVRVQVLLVHATSGTSFMDPALKRWSRHLRHLRYDSFELLERRRAALLPDRGRDFEILGDRQITITLLSKNPKRARLRVQMYRRGQKLVDTTVTVNRNGPFIRAAPSHKGGILVMPITASY